MAAFGAQADSDLPTPTRPLAQGVTISVNEKQRELSVNQSVPRAVVQWREFSVGPNNTVRFTVPEGGVTLNRVTGDETSVIRGTLQSNGQIWLLNPAGVLIGSQGSVSAKGFLAGTHQISDQDFLNPTATRRLLTNPGTGSVENQGSITTAGGYTVLIGAEVKNSGVISAHLGRIALAAGKTMALDFDGDKLINFQATEALEKDISVSLETGSKLLADGGRIWLSARTAAAAKDAVINTNGLIQANAVSATFGEILLDAGDNQRMSLRGELSAQGGSVKAHANFIALQPSTLIDTRAASAAANDGRIELNTQPLVMTQVLGSKIEMHQTASLKGGVIKITGGNEVVLGKIEATGAVDVRSQQGNISIAAAVSTTSTAPDAIVIAAATARAAGDSTGGNVMLQSAGSLTPGLGGGLRIYTGDMEAADGLVALAGTGSGRFRYHSTMDASDFTTPLGASGPYVIYREQPQVTLTAPSGSYAYGISVTAPTLASGKNGDTAQAILPEGAHTKVLGTYSSSNRPVAGDHDTLVEPVGPSALGYGFAYQAGKITVTPIDLVVSGIAARDKQADGTKAVSLNLEAATFTHLVPGDEVTVSGQFDDAAPLISDGAVQARTVKLAFSGADRDNYVLRGQHEAQARIYPSAQENKPQTAIITNPTTNPTTSPTARPSADPPANPPTPSSAPSPGPTVGEPVTPAANPASDTTSSVQNRSGNDPGARRETQPSAAAEPATPKLPGAPQAPPDSRAEGVSDLSGGAVDKPPTPRDAADVGDRTLAAVAPSGPTQPAPQARRQSARRVEVSRGVLAMQLAPRRMPVMAQKEARYSLRGEDGKW